MTEYGDLGILSLASHLLRALSLSALLVFAGMIGAANATTPAPARHMKLVCDSEGESCQPVKGPWDEFENDKEVIGAGPHVLLVTNGQTATKFDYQTGPDCLRARSAIRKQIRATGVVISATTTVCVPR